MVSFSSILGTGQVEEQNMIKDLGRFRGKLVKMIGSKFDDYSISSKIRQILLHWGYELTEKRFF